MANISDSFNAVPRTTKGKGFNRRTRATGMVPAIGYGPGLDEPKMLAIDEKTFLAARMEFGSAHVYNVQVEGEKPFKAIVKEVQRDAVSRKLDHIDLLAVDENQPIHVEVRVELEGKPHGVVLGGTLTQVRRRIEIICLPGDMPQRLVADVSNLEMGQTYHLSDLTLPEGVKPASQADLAIANLVAPSGAASDEDDDAAGEGGEEEPAAS